MLMEIFKLLGLAAILTMIIVGGICGFVLALSANEDGTTVFVKIKDITRDIFWNRNWFGYIMSCVVMIFYIPAFAAGIVTQLGVWVCKLVVHCWKFGDM